MSDTDNTPNTNPTPSQLTEGYQAQKGYQPIHIERGYQPNITAAPSLPPQGGSVIALAGQATGTSPQAAPPPPAGPPQGGSVIAPTAPTSGAEQK